MKKGKLGSMSHKKAKKEIKFLPFNRDSQVRMDLLNSMRKHGFAVPIILILTDIFTGILELFVVDGQNRLKTAIFLGDQLEEGIQIEYKILNREFKTKEEIVQVLATLNTTQDSWKLADYVNTRVYLGVDTYIKLKRYNDKYKLSYNFLSSLFYSNKGKSATATKAVEDGVFKFRYEKNANRTLSFINKLTCKGKKPDIKMCYSIHDILNMDDFDEKLFVEMYENQYDKLKKLKIDDYSFIFKKWMGLIS